MKKINAQWKCHTSSLLSEILNNNEGMTIFEKPLNIFGKMLGQVSDRAIEINDLELNKLMIRLSLYDNADIESENYMGSEMIEKYLNSKENPIKTTKENQLAMLKTMDNDIIKEYLVSQC